MDSFIFLKALKTATGSVDDIIAPYAKHFDNYKSNDIPNYPVKNIQNDVIIIEIIVPKIAYILIVPKCSKNVYESI